MKGKTNTQTTTDTSIPESSKIDAIKNIIFGENINSYNKEFEAIKTDILKKREELFDLIEDTRKALETAIDSLGTDLNIRITELDDKLAEKTDSLSEAKVDRKLLSDLFTKMADKLNH